MRNHTINKITYEELTRHMMEEEAPSGYFNRISEEPAFKDYPLYMLLMLKKAEQSPKYHPEGSVWNHTMLVVDEAAKEKENCHDAYAFMWAALLHDIGKPATTKIRKGKITSYDHDTVGARLSMEFLRYYNEEEELIEKVYYLVRYHMHMLYVLKGLPFGNPKQMVKDTDIHDIALLCRCDRMGRMGVDREEEEKNYKEFLKSIQRL